MNDQDRHNLFSELITLHQSQLYAYIFAIVRNQEDADDLFQTVCLILWRKFPLFRPGSSFFSWARQTAQREVRDFLKRKRLPSYVSEELLDALADTDLTAHSGGNAVFNGTGGYLLTPAIDLSSYRQLKISFGVDATTVANNPLVYEQYSPSFQALPGAVIGYLGASNAAAMIAGSSSSVHNSTTFSSAPANTYADYVVTYDLNANASNPSLVTTVSMNGSPVGTENGATLSQNPLTFVNRAFFIGARSDGSMSLTGTMSYFKIEGQRVPEPGTIVLLATGLLGLLAYAWRKRR